jgi:hypothetical protein
MKSHGHKGGALISEREAFVALRLFLEQFYARAGNDMETLIADVTLEKDGLPLDPAAWDDWVRCVEEARRLALG